MEIQLTLFISLIAGGFMILVLFLIKRGHLTVRYALLWFITGSIFLVLAIYPKTIETIASILGIITPSNALFFLGLIAVLFLLLALTISISKLSRENEILSQEIAIRSAYIRELQEKLTVPTISNLFDKHSDTAEKEIIS